MDTVLILTLTLLFLIHWRIITAEDLSGTSPSADSLRRYLSLYEQQRRLEKLKASHFYEPQFSDTLDSANPNLNSNPPDVGSRSKGTPGSRWDRPGQPEFSGEVGYPESTHSLRAEELRKILLKGHTPQEPEKNEETGSTGAETDFKPQTKKAQQQESGSTPNDRIPLHQPLTQPENRDRNPLSDIYFVVVVAGCSAAAIFGVIGAGYCFYRFQKNSKAAAEVDYPAYGVTGPNKDQTSPNGDRRLAQSAQMYHYQHQKQQMIAVEKATTARNTSASDIDSEEENEEGDYTVYECPGLAPTGEMEVKNPLFHDDSTPMSPPVVAKETKKP